MEVRDVEENVPMDDDTVTITNLAARVAEEEAVLPPSFKMDYTSKV